jgi:hypothetical protein
MACRPIMCHPIIALKVHAVGSRSDRAHVEIAAPCGVEIRRAQHLSSCLISRKHAMLVQLCRNPSADRTFVDAGKFKPARSLKKSRISRKARCVGCHNLKRFFLFHNCPLTPNHNLSWSWRSLGLQIALKGTRQSSSRLQTLVRLPGRILIICFSQVS